MTDTRTFEDGSSWTKIEGEWIATRPARGDDPIDLSKIPCRKCKLPHTGACTHDFSDFKKPLTYEYKCDGCESVHRSIFSKQGVAHWQGGKVCGKFHRLRPNA